MISSLKGLQDQICLRVAVISFKMRFYCASIVLIMDGFYK
nr:MAG TPA: hypothetical protein [Caudoviricetes sp.]